MEHGGRAGDQSAVRLAVPAMDASLCGGESAAGAVQSAAGLAAGRRTVAADTASDAQGRGGRGRFADARAFVRAWTAGRGRFCRAAMGCGRLAGGDGGSAARPAAAQPVCGKSGCFSGGGTVK